MTTLRERIRFGLVSGVAGLAMAFALAACGDNGEEAGDVVEDTAEEAGEAVEEAGEAAEDAAEEAQ